MSMDWTSFLGGFQQGTAIGNQLGAQYNLRQLQNQEVTQIPGQPAQTSPGVVGTGIAAQQPTQPAQPFAGEIKPMSNTDTSVEGVPQPSGAMAFPVSPEGPASDNFGAMAAVQQQPQQQPLPDPQQVQQAQGAEDAMSAMRYSFLGKEYDEKPTDLQIQQARAHARANIYEEFNQPGMAAQARNFGDQLGIKGMQKKILDYQTKELERKEQTEMQVLQYKQEGLDAYAGKEGAFSNLVNDFGGASTADGVMAVDVDKDGKYTITAYDPSGNVKGKPQEYAHEAAIPHKLRNQLIGGMMAEKYGRLGPKFQSDYFQQLMQKEQLQAGRQNFTLNKKKFEENVRQFDVSQAQSESEIKRNQQNWESQYTMNIMKLSDSREEQAQQMELRAEQIRKLKNPPQAMWHAQLKILDEPWNAPVPQIAWAMGLDVLDKYTVKAIEDWQAKARQDAQKAALVAQGEIPPVN